MKIKCTKKFYMVLLVIVFLQNVSFGFQRKYEESREKRANDRMPPEKVMDAIGVKPGMIIGELGAGRGRYTVHLANRVGSQGKILANDISERALAYLRERCRRNSIQNIETILGKMDDPLLPSNSLDMVVMVWVYHMLEQPLPILKNLKPSLKPGAMVVILDPPDEEIDEEIKMEKGKLDPNRPTIKERIETGAAATGYKVVKILTFLPKDTIYILQVKDQ